MALQLAHLEAAMHAADTPNDGSQRYASTTGAAWVQDGETAIPGYTPGGAKAGRFRPTSSQGGQDTTTVFTQGGNFNMSAGDVLPLRALERTPVVGVLPLGASTQSGAWMSKSALLPDNAMALSTPAAFMPAGGEVSIARSADFLQAVVKGQSKHLQNLQHEHSALQNDFTLVHGSAAHNAVLVQSLQTELREKSTQVDALRQENAVLANRIQELEYAGVKTGCCVIM